MPRAIRILGLVSLSVIVGCGAGSSPAAEEIDPPDHTTSVQQAGSADDDLLDAPDSDYATVPGNRMIHKSCLLGVPAGSDIDAPEGIVKYNGSVIATMGKCRYKAKHHNPDGTTAVTPPPSADGTNPPFIYVPFYTSTRRPTPSATTSAGSLAACRGTVRSGITACRAF